MYAIFMLYYIQRGTIKFLHGFEYAHEDYPRALASGLFSLHTHNRTKNEPQHEISNNVICATSKGSDQPDHTRRLIRAFASRLHFP